MEKFTKAFQNMVSILSLFVQRPYTIFKIAQETQEQSSALFWEKKSHGELMDQQNTSS